MAAATLSEFLSPNSETSAGQDSSPVIGTMSVGDGEFGSVRYRVPERYVVRELRGAKMRDTEGVFDEFAAAFQFPYYFGANKDAFDECLRDLDDFVGSAPGYVVVLRKSELLLADQPDLLSWFESAIADAARHWARRAVVFRVVAQGRPSGLRTVVLTA